MASTVFQDYNENTPIVAAWLNDVNEVTYDSKGTRREAVAIPLALVRFSVALGEITIQQSLNIASVIRESAGVFTITYQKSLAESTNFYQISSNIPGFLSYGSETSQSVTVNVTDTTNSPVDPDSCCVAISSNG